MSARHRSPARIAVALCVSLIAAACAAETPAVTSENAPTTAAPDRTTTTTVPATTTSPEPVASESTFGFNEDGHPRLGDADAPVTLVEFSDYLCPFCGRHFTDTKPLLIEQYAASGAVNFVFRDFPIEDLHPNAPAGHAAGLCVAEQDASMFWAFHDQLFSDQEAWESLADPGPYLEDVAEQVGADLDAYGTCIASGRSDEAVERSITEVRELGFSATPSFQIIDNRTGEVYELVGAQPFSVFTSTLDAVLAGGAPPTTAPPPPPELPFWLSAQGLSPDPERPGYTLGGDPYTGNPEAELVVVEVSDFQCPFCQRHSFETQPALDEAYVDTGRILWVFKHLPLPIHPQAVDAAVASECAGDQGSFWQMHDLLFETVERWAVDSPGPALTDLAIELELDATSFSACLESRAALERVLSDSNDLSGIIGSTPTFIILQEGRAGVIEGAQPLENFVGFFDQVLGGE
jgi:protein-disulfide isomerase